ncbi:MAG TPA: DciA family protein [Candidatus Limnocylindrales bacterium]|nr:DciA family protein [Candidatus Limnocylindrales bacterium]
MSEDAPRRRRPMQRIGDLMPAAAAGLGLQDELRKARFVSTFDAIVAELAPAAHGACRALRVEGETLVVEADAPIVGQEVLLHAGELAAAFTRAPAGLPVRQVRVTIRRR